MKTQAFTGYQLHADSLKAAAADGTIVPLEVGEEGVLSFVMPAQAVALQTAFEAVPDHTVTVESTGSGTAQATASGVQDGGSIQIRMQPEEGNIVGSIAVNGQPWPVPAQGNELTIENVVATLTVTPCWCYGSETFDMDPRTIKAVWGFNGTERPGAVYLAAVLAAHAQKGLPAFSIYGHDVQDATDTGVPADVAEKILRFARCAVAVGWMKNKAYVNLGGVAMMLGTLVTGTAPGFHDVRTYWSPEACERVTGHKPEGVAKDGFIHLINSGATALDGSGAATNEKGEHVMKLFWQMIEQDMTACLEATDWCRANYEYFRGGGFSSHFRCAAEMPVTLLRVNIVESVGPVLQLAEGWTANLPAGF